MKIRLVSPLRTLLAGICLLASVSVSAADRYATPAGAGSKNGTSWANAYDQALLQTAITATVAGDTLYLGSGDFTGKGYSISGSGTSGAKRRIVGVDTGSGLPRFLGTFVLTSSANTNNVVFNFPGAASHWEIRNLRFRQHGFPIDMPASGTTYTLRSNLLFDNLDFERVEDAIRIKNAENITVSNCDVFQHTKKAFRYGAYTRFIAYTNCQTDAKGGDETFPTRSIPNGFAGDDTLGASTIHDITLTDCVARNNRFGGQTGYWNGDGYSTEEGTYNVTYTRCSSYDNHDGGFDDKASNTVYNACIAIGNKRGFRHHAAAPLLNPIATFNNCLAAYSKEWPGNGSGSADGFWVANDDGTPFSSAVNYVINNSTSHNNVATAVRIDSTGSSQFVTLTVNNSILSVDGSFSSGVFTSAASGTITLAASTATYSPGSGTNPNYIAPSLSWTGSPANAFDSQTYGAAKGYNSANTGGDGGGDTTAPSVPAGLASSAITSSSFTLSWAASTDNAGGSGVNGYEVFRNGVSIATPSGTSLSVTGLSASTTYAMTVRSRDVAGNWSAQSTPLNVTTSAGGGTPTTVTFQDGVSGYAGTTDATIKSASATSNFGTNVLLEVDGDPDQAALLRFNLATIPASATVTTVALTFNITNGSANAYPIYALKRAFAEGSTTWNIAQTGVNWQTAGANGANDRETTSLGATPTGTGTLSVTLNAAGISKVQSWVSTPATNFGFIIMDAANTDGADLRSSGTGTATQRPKISVTYQ